MNKIEDLIEVALSDDYFEANHALWALLEASPNDAMKVCEQIIEENAVDVYLLAASYDVLAYCSISKYIEHIRKLVNELPDYLTVNIVNSIVEFKPEIESIKDTGLIREALKNINDIVLSKSKPLDVKDFVMDIFNSMVKSYCS